MDTMQETINRFLTSCKRKGEKMIENWPTKKYGVIYIDPPWSYNDKQNTTALGGAIKHYPCMNIQELKTLPVKQITEDNCVMFMWATSPFLENALELVKQYGFKYKTSFVWDKVKHNMGHYNSVRHEFLLVCTKGSKTPEVRKLFDSVVSEERTIHSKKPEIFRTIINTLYPSSNKIELFARQKTEGWDVWGNEV
jgi:N6-adenosine-specific RNA methylase IME4